MAQQVTQVSVLLQALADSQATCNALRAELAALKAKDAPTPTEGD